LSKLLLEKLIVAQLGKKSPPFMRHEGLLPCSQKTASGACPEPDEFSLHISYSETRFNIVLTSTSRSPK